MRLQTKGDEPSAKGLIGSSGDLDLQLNSWTLLQ